MTPAQIAGLVLAGGLGLYVMTVFIASMFFGPPDREDDDGERWT